MATLVRNNTGGAIPLPPQYGFGYVRNDDFVIINDSPSNVYVLLGLKPGDGVTLTPTADSQPGAITPLTPLQMFATVAALLYRTPNVAMALSLAEGVAAGELIATSIVPNNSVVEGASAGEVYNGQKSLASPGYTEGVTIGDVYTMALLSADGLIEGAAPGEVLFRN